MQKLFNSNSQEKELHNHWLAMGVNKMARNDIVLLDSLIEKSKSQLGVHKDASEIFELFSFDQLLKDYDPSFEELESGWTDGGNDGGIDGFFVFVDSRIAIPDASIYALRKSPEIDVHIFSSRRSTKFEQQPLDSLIGSLAEIFDLSIEEKNLKYSTFGIRYRGQKYGLII